jgi:cell wall-associated NlpC family hydrolase
LAPLGTHGSHQNPEDSKNSTGDQSASIASQTGSAFATRRAARAARSGRDVAPVGSTTPAAARAKKKRLKGGVANIAVMTIAAGIIATVALPAYAFNPTTKDESKFGSSVIDGMKKANSQSVTVSGAAVQPVVARDAVTATTQEELDAAKAAQAAEAAAAAAREAATAEMANYGAAYSGPSVSDFLANPPYPNFSLSQVFSVAQQYIGTPYVYGGASPAGFDCSGYVMFVYAQFGISLPHSVSGQAAAGTRISINDAVPGDIVIMSGHDGFYAGNGNIMDAPDVGRSISIRPIWTSDYYIVRLGI